MDLLIKDLFPIEKRLDRLALWTCCLVLLTIGKANAQDTSNPPVTYPNDPTVMTSQGSNGTATGGHWYGNF